MVEMRLLRRTVIAGVGANFNLIMDPLLDDSEVIRSVVQTSLAFPHMPMSALFKRQGFSSN